VVAALQNLPELASGFDASTLQLFVSELITPKKFCNIAELYAVYPPKSCIFVPSIVY
jgi:hypothetical protein